jgi:hypothetical protein
VAGDDEQAGNFGEISGEVFSDAIAEILLLRVATDIGKGQDNNGRLVGQR